MGRIRLKKAELGELTFQTTFCPNDVKQSETGEPQASSFRMFDIVLAKCSLKNPPGPHLS